MLDNGCILYLEGKHTFLDHFNFSQEPLDEKGRKLSNDAVICEVYISDLFRYKPGMRWTEFGRACALYQTDMSLWWVMADQYVKDYCTEQGIEYTYIEFWKDLDDPDMRDSYSKDIADFEQLRQQQEATP